MTFLRVKNIKGNAYAYLVENKWTSSGPRQSVKRYLGRVYKIKGQGNYAVKNKDGRKDFLLELVKYELGKIKSGLSKEGIKFDEKRMVFFKERRSCVLGLNQGFMCDFTLKRILNFKKSNDLEKDSVKLAKFFIEAGFDVPQKHFIEYFQRL